MSLWCCGSFAQERLERTVNEDFHKVKRRFMREMSLFNFAPRWLRLWLMPQGRTETPATDTGPLHGLNSRANDSSCRGEGLGEGACSVSWGTTPPPPRS